MSNSAPRFSFQAVIGLLVIVVGLLLTADNLQLFEADWVFRFWPLAIVIAGLAKIVQSRATSGRVLGAIIILIGAVLTAENTFRLPIRLEDVWPLALVVLGAVILYRTLGAGSAAAGAPAPAAEIPDTAPPHPFDNPVGAAAARDAAPRATDFAAGVAGSSTEESLTEVAFWAGKQRRVASASFRRGDLTAVMGGIELDLRAAGTATGEAIIDVFVMWGGIEIWVPPDWAVVNKVGVLMAGVEDKSTGTQDARNRLIVRGFVVMGGLEIKT
jgi:hypothetical protein